MIISLEFELPRTSCGLPEDYGWDPVDKRHSRVPILLFGLAPGDAYPAGSVTTAAVGSYSTISPLPDPQSKRCLGHGHRRYVFCGAGVGSLRLGVTQHPFPWSPDFPPELKARAIIRSPPTRPITLTFLKLSSKVVGQQGRWIDRVTPVC